MQVAAGDMGGELVPEGDRQVLGRGNHPAQEFDFLVEIAVVAVGEDVGLDEGVEVGQIDDVTGRRVGLPAYRDL